MSGKKKNAKKKNELSFNAEIREVKMRKLISLDAEVTAKFSTNELQTLDLGKIDSDTVVEVSVRW